MEYENALIHESSPYLLQHAHNPVNWYPWGEEALQKARTENKMLLISIGYAACHLCHVMERESFADAEIAGYMNEHFINIKVDREERPDIDMIYMSAAQLINGNGGWPLNALALPDGKPFFAATYFPPARWKQLLQYFVNEYATNTFALEEQAAYLSKGIAQVDRIAPQAREASAFDRRDLEAIHNALYAKTDQTNGGLSSAIKFPMPSVWEWLLDYHHLTGADTSFQAVERTLDKMLNGGIYDQIGGGFARYATDTHWHVPHFEKMLYDNAQMIQLYAAAYQVSGHDRYRAVVYDTVHFLQRELSDGTIFYSSVDADSEGEEGRFYVWTRDEIEEVLGPETDDFCETFGITQNGNWEDGKNVPDRNMGKPAHDGEDAGEKKQIAIWREHLLRKREERIRPALDDKMITAWNAMTSGALLKAGRGLDDEDLIVAAEKNIRFLSEHLWDQEREILYRNYKGGRRSVPGFLDDYAFLIHALLQLYQTTFDSSCMAESVSLIDTVFKHFSDQTSNMFFYNDERFQELISRPVDTNDGVIPSSNSVMADNLLVAGLLLDRTDWVERAHLMVHDLKSDVLAHPEYNAHWARVLLRSVAAPFEIAVVGDQFRRAMKALQKEFEPLAIYCGSKQEENLPLLEGKYRQGETLIYVCRNKVCQQPTNNTQEALNQLKTMRGAENQKHTL